MQQAFGSIQSHIKVYHEILIKADPTKYKASIEYTGVRRAEKKRPKGVYVKNGPKEYHHDFYTSDEIEKKYPELVKYIKF